MFPRSMMLVASLPVTVGIASDALAHRRPEPPPPVVYQTDVPERYRVAEREVLERLEQPQTCAPAPCATTVVVKHVEPVDIVYGRQPCAPPPQVVVVQPPPIAVCPPPRPRVVECRPAYDYRPSYSYYGGVHENYRPVNDCGPRDGFHFSVRIGDDCGSSFRYGYTNYGYRDRGWSRGYSDCGPRVVHRRRCR